MKDRAYAKINLCLDVVRKREDGYHELNMIMVPINFYDLLEITPAEKTTMKLNVGYIPIDEKNTVIKAINIMKETYGIKDEFRINLTKHVPTQAGLAGGSADAASAIRILNRMYHLHMTLDEMIAIGKKVGADVPFCLVKKPSVVSGIGEVIEPFEMDCDFYLMLVKPKSGVMTKSAFEGIDFNTVIHPNVEKMKEALMSDDYQTFVNELGNSLEASSFKLNPSIENIKKEMKELGFDGVLMSGSGSTVFGVTRKKYLIEKASEVFKKKRYFIRSTKILGGYR